MIFRIYDKFPFLHIPSDFCLLVIFRVKIWHKLNQFSCLFGMVLTILWPTTWTILIKLGLKWDKMNTKETQITAWYNIEPFLRCLRSYQPKSIKIDLNLWMMQKIFEKWVSFPVAGQEAIRFQILSYEWKGYEKFFKWKQ